MTAAVEEYIFEVQERFVVVDKALGRVLLLLLLQNHLLILFQL
jgi:hypothetical protein